MKRFAACIALLLASTVRAHGPDATVVEYFHAGLGHYFMTASASEAAALDAGTRVGWARTGAAFRAYLEAHADVTGLQPVCRYYGLPAAGLDSHFYSASPAECADVAAKFPTAWQLESPNVFYIQVPDGTGTCAAGMQPVYRVWNGRIDSNHRYTTSAAVRQQMIDAHWTPEGAGTLGVVMCAALAIDLARLPIGDGKVSTSPRAGYVWSCQTQFNGGGALHDGPWFNGDGTWNKAAKIAVRGSVTWTSTFVEALNAQARALSGNGLPSHATGTFPVATSDPAYAYDRNPNSIRAQSVALALPALPALAASPACLPQGPIGILVTGAQLFNALDAAGRDAAAHEVQDACDGHPESSGAYHYHSLPPCLATADVPGRHSALAGYAKDGFGLFGNQGEGGVALTNADLDECHGHVHAIDWNGTSVALYHYHATYEYPYTLGCYRGTPVR